SPHTTMGLGKLAPGQGNLGLRQQVVSPPGPGEAMVKVIASGVCGTDLHIADDEFPYEAPVTMGHEVTGVVSEVGSANDAGWLGKRVALETYHSFCGVCRHCRAGSPNLCAHRRSIGSREDGGFAAWISVPVRNLWEVPDSVGVHAGALVEPLACVTHIMLDPPLVDPGDHVLVLGPGTMGLLTAQVAHASGGRVTVAGLESDRARLDLAASLGMTPLVLSDTSDDLATAPSVVCECSGSAAAATFGLEQVAKGGRYVQVGIFGEVVTIPFDQVLYKELTVTSGNASTPASWRRAITLLEEGLVALDPLVTEVAPLADWERVFAAVRAGDGVKYLLSPGEEG
ncbi:MAG TPA: alcohol dehydrogenase catalytic domain-containing protein, partial [Acidimicrobiia bacterium]